MILDTYKPERALVGVHRGATWWFSDSYVFAWWRVKPFPACPTRTGAYWLDKAHYVRHGDAPSLGSVLDLLRKATLVAEKPELHRLASAVDGVKPQSVLVFRSGKAQKVVNRRFVQILTALMDGAPEEWRIAADDPIPVTAWEDGKLLGGVMPVRVGHTSILEKV